MAEEEMINEDEIPVFLINGFLEAGKTCFLRFTLKEEYFNTGERTLLILCEEGEEEYPVDLLRDTKTSLVRVGSKEEIGKDALKAMEAAYSPERIIIEWNGMWPQNDLILPDGWFLNQQITIIDTTTFDTYLKNMKPLLGQMLRYSELVICNRADGFDEKTLGDFRTKIKTMAQGAEIVFEGREGEIRGDFSIDLPYDINASHIAVLPEDYGIFYIDIMDRPERYDGKTVTFTGEILAPPELKKGFVVGRRVMTCCEADIQFLGPICRYASVGKFKNGEWVKVTGKIRCEKEALYNGPGPVIYVDEVIRTGAIREPASF